MKLFASVPLHSLAFAFTALCFPGTSGAATERMAGDPFGVVHVASQALLRVNAAYFARVSAFPSGLFVKEPDDPIIDFPDRAFILPVEPPSVSLDLEQFIFPAIRRIEPALSSGATLVSVTASQGGSLALGGSTLLTVEGTPRPVLEGGSLTLRAGDVNATSTGSSSSARMHAGGAVLLSSGVASTVPEPSMPLLFGAGLGVLAWARRRSTPAPSSA